MKREKKRSDGNLISFSVLLTPEGKIVSEISEFPVDQVDVVFSEMDRQIIRVLLQRAKAKLEPLHVYLQREIQDSATHLHRPILDNSRFLHHYL